MRKIKRSIDGALYWSCLRANMPLRDATADDIKQWLDQATEEERRNVLGQTECYTEGYRNGYRVAITEMLIELRRLLPKEHHNTMQNTANFLREKGTQ